MQNDKHHGICNAKTQTNQPQRMHKKTSEKQRDRKDLQRDKNDYKRETK